MLVSLVYIHLDHIPNLKEQIEKNIVLHELQTTKPKKYGSYILDIELKTKVYELNRFR